MSITTNSSGVRFIRNEVRQLLPQYQVISDCLEGEKKVKSRKETYLPNPSSQHDDKDEAATRYAAYILRAVFYNFTRRTLQGLCGQAFSKPPSMQVPTQLEPVVKSVSGDGISLEQQAKRAVELTLAYSRAGLLVDFPNTGGVGASREDIDSGSIRPTITLYKAEDIINWRVKDVNAEEVLTMLVLREIHQVQDPSDPFVLHDEEWFRVLELGQTVSVKIWKPTQQKQGVYANDASYQEYILTAAMQGGDGLPLKRIPWFPIGLSANSMAVEPPAFYDLASLNIAHYRNSADYEEMLFITGQPTPIASGLTEEWIDKQLKGRLNFGSRGGIPLPSGGDADLLQIAPNDALSAALEQKERQAVALGAKLVEQKQVQRTATESKIESTAEGSVLESVANNASSAYLKALQLCCQMLQVEFNDETLQFQINTDFDLTKLTPADLSQVLNSMNGGILSWTEVRRAYRAVGLAVQDDDKAKAEIDEMQQKKLDEQVALFSAGPAINKE